MQKKYDLAIVGNGLAATRFFIEYSKILMASPSQTIAKMQVAIIGPVENMARGLPYGNSSDPAALLIENLEKTECPEFNDWVEQNRHDALTQYQMATDVPVNFEKISVSGLNFPRHTFGLFNQACFEDAAEASKKILQLDLIDAHVIDIHRVNDNYELYASSGENLLAANVILATGSIAKAGEDAGDHFLNDQYRQPGFLHVYVERLLKKVARPLQIATLGSNASAVETLHLLRKYYKNNIGHITMMSDTGFYPAAIENEVFEGTPVTYLPCCKEYSESAFEWINDDKLNLLKTVVVDVLPEQDSVFVLHNSQLSRFDLVIDCRGAGKTTNTKSNLIRQLGRKTWLSHKKSGRGFQMSNHHQIAGLNDFFVIGPLQNDDDPSTHVESIRGVFKSAKSLANLFAKQYESNRTILTS